MGEYEAHAAVIIDALWKSPEVILPEEHPELRAWLADRDEFAGHVVFKTSGSSGVEKWVALSKAALDWSARRVIESLGMSEGDVCGLALPIIHVGGFGLALRAYLSGALLVEFEGKWNAAKFGEWCSRAGVTISSLVPTQVRDLVAEGVRAPGCMRAVVVGGGVLNAALKEEARTLGWPLLPSYGMTETSAQIATGDGLPLLPGWEVRVENERLAVKGGGLLSAVITRKGGSFQALDPKVDGWYLTQDRVELQGRNLRVLGRADRQVKVLGKLVDLEVLERFWKEKVGCEVALMARPDERRGSGIYLYLEGDDRDVARINRGLPGPERLLAWQVLKSLPRSPLGKVDRASLPVIPSK
jgi:O-succinylbenzoic acid--CoA ligase